MGLAAAFFAVAHRRRMRLAGVLSVVAMLVLMGGAGAARAQEQAETGRAVVVRHASFGDAASFLTPVGRRSLDDYARLLNMTPEQVEAMRALHEGYRAEFQTVQEEIRTAMGEAQRRAAEEGDFTVFSGRQFTARMRQLNERAAQSERVFYEDLRALLTPAQQERWHRVERHRRRETLMRFGLVSGQTVDLVRMLAAMRIDPAAVPGLEDQVERYEADLDRALQEMVRFQAEQQQVNPEDFDVTDFSRMGEMMQKAQEMMKQLAERARAIRDVNRRHFRAMQALLPDSERGRFEAEFNRRCFPRVYRESYPSRIIAAAEAFSDLTPEQRQALREVKETYGRELEAANRRWAAAIEELDEQGGPMANMMSLFSGGGRGGAVGEARRARRELDNATREKVFAILTPAQKERLPAEPREPQGFAAWGELGGFDIQVLEDSDGP